MLPSIPPSPVPEPGFPLVVSGPSGVGKTSLVQHLLEIDERCVRSISVTTRPQRAGESDCDSYFFLDEERFLQMREKGELAESAIYGGFWYGTPRRVMEESLRAGRVVVLNIEVQGGAQIRSLYADAVLVFVLPPSWDDLERRLLGRGTESPEVAARRIERAREELLAIHAYDYVVVNDDLQRCAADLHAIVRAERRRTRRLYPPDASPAS
ncbi:MAG: guanylate kinase [Candidatus Eisenbacteria bacterium]|nr:guanylate kinase [Candidatus Eisenbacteria bacterium]